MADEDVVFQGHDPDGLVLAGREELGYEDVVSFEVPQVDRALERLGDQEQFSSVQALTEWGKKNAAQEWIAGTRVSFVSNLESMLTYPDCPDPGTNGTVVTVRTGSGDRTTEGDHVFVLWDDGKFRAMVAHHLQQEGTSRTANSVRMVVSDFGDISSFFSPASGTGNGDDLVHKATQDLWALKQEGGQYVIERLFNEDGNPLKV